MGVQKVKSGVAKKNKIGGKAVGKRRSNAALRRTKKRNEIVKGISDGTYPVTHPLLYAPTRKWILHLLQDEGQNLKVTKAAVQYAMYLTAVFTMRLIKDASEINKCSPKYKTLSSKCVDIAYKLTQMTTMPLQCVDGCEVNKDT